MELEAKLLMLSRDLRYPCFYIPKHMTAIGAKNSNSHVARIELCLTLTIAHPLNLEFRLSKYIFYIYSSFSLRS